MRRSLQRSDEKVERWLKAFGRFIRGTRCGNPPSVPHTGPEKCNKIDEQEHSAQMGLLRIKTGKLQF